MSSISINILHAYNNDYSYYLQDIAAKRKDVVYERKMEMAKDAAVIAKILELLENKHKTRQVYDALEMLIVEEKIKVNFIKTLNYDNFRRLLTNWKRGGVEQVARINYVGNNNASKFKNDAELEAWILYLRMDKRNLSGEHIQRVVKHNCRLAEKEIPSDSWLSHKLADGHLKALAASKRYDRGNRHRQGTESILHGIRCPQSNDRWEVDGTRVNLLAFEHFGKVVFLYAVWVYDNHSGDILGWCFSTSDSPENRWVYTDALKMAVNRTGALPREIAFDRFAGHNTTEMKAIFEKFEQIGTKVTITHRAEGKQHLERAIGTFQTVFLSQSDYYYGQGVKSSREAAHVTTELQKEQAKKLRKLGIGYEQMCAEVERFVEQYRTTKLTEYGRQNKYRIPYSPAELFQISDKSNQRTVEVWQISDLFWLQKRLSLRNRQFKTEINHETCVYMVENYEMLVRLEREEAAIIKYDEKDLSEVYVFSELNNEFLGCLKRFEMAVTRGVEASGEAIGKYKRIQKEIDERQMAEVKEKIEAIDENKLTAYWGKEASYRAEEAYLSSGYQAEVTAKVARKKDIYDEDWGV